MKKFPKKVDYSFNNIPFFSGDETSVQKTGLKVVIFEKDVIYNLYTVHAIVKTEGLSLTSLFSFM